MSRSKAEAYECLPRKKPGDPELNWKSARQYRRKLSPELWAWEFLRRNSDYRQDWERALGLYEAEWKDGIADFAEEVGLGQEMELFHGDVDLAPDHVGPDDPRFLLPAYQEGGPDAFDSSKWRLRRFANPDCARPTRLWFRSTFGNTVGMRNAWGCEYESRVRIRPWRVLFEVDLRMDLGQQTDRLRRNLGPLQWVWTREGHKIFRPKEQFGNFHLYLRLLDASAFKRAHPEKAYYEDSSGKKYRYRREYYACILRPDEEKKPTKKKKKRTDLEWAKRNLDEARRLMRDGYLQTILNWPPL